MDYSKDYNDLPPQDDLCPKCEEEDMQIEYWWKNGIKEGPTGDVVCESCGYREQAFKK